MTTAFDVMLAVADVAGPLVSGVATGGSGTTIVDTTLLGVVEGQADDEYRGGTVFLVADAGGAGAAPQGETARVTDYVAATGTLTLYNGDLSAAAGAGDSYGVCTIPRGHLFRAINSALRDLGPVPFEDDTSLDTAASTLAYTIPAAAKADLCQVWLALNTTAPITWEEWRDWYQIKNKATYDLVFLAQPPATRDIRLVYVGPHAAVSADADAIAAAVPLDYLIWRSVYHIYHRRAQDPGRSAQQWTGLANEAAEYAAQALAKHPIRLPAYTPKLFSYDDPNTSLPRGATIQTVEVPTS